MMENIEKAMMICAGLSIFGFVLSGAEPLWKWDLDEWTGNQTRSINGKAIMKMIGEKDSAKKVPGIYGQAVHCSGDYESRRHNGGLITTVKPEIFTAPFTLELWVKFDDKINYRNSRQIAGNGGDRGPGFRLAYWYNQFWVISGDGKKMISAESPRTLVVPKDQWLHLVLAYQKDEVVLYMNAKEILRKKMTLTLGRPALTIGSHRSGFAYPLNGAVDEIKIYNTVLKEDEITDHFEKGNIR